MMTGNPTGGFENNNRYLFLWQTINDCFSILSSKNCIMIRRNAKKIKSCILVGLNRVPNFAEYQVFEAVFAEFRVPIPSI